MRFSYTDTAVVSSSPTGRHLSTVIRRPCVLMSGWDEHAAEICRVLNELSPSATMAQLVEQGYLEPLPDVLTNNWPRASADLQEIAQSVLDELRSSTRGEGFDNGTRLRVTIGGKGQVSVRGDSVLWEGQIPTIKTGALLQWFRQGGRTLEQIQEKCQGFYTERRAQCRCADEAVQTSGIFVAQDGTVRAETKQRGVHWRGTVPADKTLELLTWAGKGPHTVQQVREKCEELSAPKQVFAGQRFPKNDDTLENWKEYGLKIYEYAVNQGQTMAQLTDELEKARAQLNKPVEVSANTAQVLLSSVPGVRIYSVGNKNRTLVRV